MTGDATTPTVKAVQRLDGTWRALYRPTRSRWPFRAVRHACGDEMRFANQADAETAAARAQNNLNPLTGDPE